MYNTMPQWTIVYIHTYIHTYAALRCVALHWSAAADEIKQWQRMLFCYAMRGCYAGWLAGWRYKNGTGTYRLTTSGGTMLISQVSSSTASQPASQWHVAFCNSNKPLPLQLQQTIAIATPTNHCHCDSYCFLRHSSPWSYSWKHNTAQHRPDTYLENAISCTPWNDGVAHSYLFLLHSLPSSQKLTGTPLVTPIFDLLVNLAVSRPSHIAKGVILNI